MAESYLRDKKRLLSCAAYLNGEYGVSGLYIGVPVILGGNGVERIVELSLTSEERASFSVSIEAVSLLIQEMEKFMT